jgi:N-acetylglutamate synthase-like GNAT family acetyltransferase
MIRIRPAVPADASGIAALLCQLGYPDPPQAIEKRLRELAAQAAGVVLVAENDRGQLAGCIHVAIDCRLAEGRKGEITSLVVDEAQRSNGTGARLVLAASDWLQARGLDRLRVRCNAVRHRAHAFYEGLGFQLTKTQKVFDLPIGPSKKPDSP